MNSLAQTVHDLMTGRKAAKLSHLAPLEQAALTDLKSLFNGSPQELAAALARGEAGIDWTKSTALAVHPQTRP